VWRWWRGTADARATTDTNTADACSTVTGGHPSTDVRSDRHASTNAHVGLRRQPFRLGRLRW
jgi:hypothetical protein